MKFVNKFYLIVWAILLIVSLMFVYPYSQNCRYEIEPYSSTCITMWDIIIWDLVLVSVVYNLLYFVYYKWKNKKIVKVKKKR